jgi:hypothetical protein
MERLLGRTRNRQEKIVEMFIKIVLSSRLPVVSTKLVVYKKINYKQYDSEISMQSPTTK